MPLPKQPPVSKMKNENEEVLVVVSTFKRQFYSRITCISVYKHVLSVYNDREAIKSETTKI